MAKTNQMIHMLVDESLLKRIEDFRFRARFATRTESIRWLLDAALKAKLTPKARRAPMTDEPSTDLQTPAVEKALERD